MNKHLFYITFAIVASILCVSCGSSRKTVYFQGIDSADMSAGASRNEMTIKSGDNLYISVTSTRPEAVEMFNKIGAAFPATLSSATLPLIGYIVDAEGNINFTGIGTIHVGGLTKLQAENLIREKLSIYVSDATVGIRFLNFKITVLGEVVRPGTYPIQDERITLPEALGLAGDMTIYGIRNNVLICREKNGKKEFHRVDMTSSDVFKSDFYYLQQNDIVYVQPNRARTGVSTYNQNLPLGVSALSLLLTIFALFYK